MMANPYVFIVGCPRSGTTLLQRMVTAHPQIAITSRAHWICKLFEKRDGLTPEGFVTPRLIPRLFEDSKFFRLKIGREELFKLLEDRPGMLYPELVRHIFDRYSRHIGKALVGNKTPWFVRRLSLLHALWPAARFVHLIRDGRDVCLSMRDWPREHQNHPGAFPTWRDDSASTAALWWELNVRLGRQAGESLGPKLYYELRYESLIAHPEEECAALCAFLDLPYDDAMLRFHEGRTKTDPALDAKRAWRPITPGLRDWRSKMAAEDVERYEAAAGELLEKLGYPRAVARPRPETLEHTSQIRDSLLQDPLWIEAMPPDQAERPGFASQNYGPWAEGHSARPSLKGGAA